MMIYRVVLGLFLIQLIGGVASAQSEMGRCEVRKIKASGDYSRCLSRNLAAGKTGRDERCERRLAARFRKAERRGSCVVEGDAQLVGSFLSDANTVVGGAIGDGAEVPIIIEPVCDPSAVRLLDFEVWNRENGYWIGEYTFLGADGDPNQSANWPYRYDHYRGFIHLEVSGNSIRQRNVFLYPANDISLCTGDPADVKGDGTCGVNGNEKIFSADQSASDCRGDLEGLFVTAFGNADTYTTLVGDNRVLYEVVFASAPFAGNLMQSQLTTLPGNGTRVRTAQGFNVVTEAASYGSFYRERKVSEAEFFAEMEATRAEYNIRVEDYCAWDGVTNAPSGVTCQEHFSE